jgi:TonB-dependent receptor
MTLLAGAIAVSSIPTYAAAATANSTRHSHAKHKTEGAAESLHQSDADKTTQSKKNHKQATPDPGSNRESTPKKLSKVVVTAPLLKSLSKAEAMKQASSMIADSIVSEDIGKLPDNSVAAALQRIPGVQVAPDFQGEVANVSVNGLPDVVTTLNGRNIFSGVGRGYAFQNLPATAVKSLTVYKTSDARLLDGGIAGLVNVQLHRPFDFNSPVIAGTFKEQYTQSAHHADPSGSLLLSDRWNTGAGEFGALVNFSMLTKHYEYNAVWGDFPTVLTGDNGDPIRTSSGNLIAVPNALGADYNIGYRKRPEVNYALQWAPNSHLQFYAEGLLDWDRDNYDQPFYFSDHTNAVSPSAYTVTDNCYSDQEKGSKYYGQKICDAASGKWSGNYYAATSTQVHQQWGHDIQYAGGVKWNRGPWSVSSDLSYTTSTFVDQTFIVDTFLKRPLTTVWAGTAGNHQNWYLTGPQGNRDYPANPNNYYLNGLFQTWNNQFGNELAWKLNGEYQLNIPFVKSLQFGLRFSNHAAKYIGSIEKSIPPPGGGNNPVPENKVVNQFQNGYFCTLPSESALPQSWLSGCYDFLVNHKNKIRALYGAPLGLLPENPGRFYHIREKKYTGYLQLPFSEQLFGIPFDGLLGLRYQVLQRDLDAFLFNQGNYSPLDDQTTGRQLLPNFSIRFHLTPDLQARLIAAKTITYPGFGSLNPSLSLNPPTINRPGEGNSGNPNLKPIKSDNYDASLEWYFAPSGYLSGDLFYHSINGFLENYVQRQTINGVPYQITLPQSAGSGHIKGAELAYQQFFRFLPGPLDGLGVQLNYTYITGNTSAPAYVGGPNIISPLQNVSKNNFNAVLVYEKYGLSARLAYNFRSKYIDFFTPPYVDGIQDFIQPANQLDLGISYNITPHWTLTAGATNLTGAVLHEYFGSGKTRPHDIRYQTRTYSLGFRFKY